MDNLHDLWPEQGRREAEISLLQAMYPDNVQWNNGREELTYSTADGVTLTVRVSGDYPGRSRPVLVSAFDSDKTDLRDLTRSRIEELNLQPDEEILDSVVQAFEEAVKDHASRTTAIDSSSPNPDPVPSAQGMKFKTVIVWLHHLLNTNKRKLALNPSLAPETVAGVTKPGHPGVLIFSGEQTAVDAHCAELRSQRWQKFQVRYDDLVVQPWRFSHLSGIVEVETMSEVTQSILDPGDRDAFLRAIGVK